MTATLSQDEKQRIATTFLSDAHPVEQGEQPSAIIIGGGSGVGKTHFREKWQDLNPEESMSQVIDHPDYIDLSSFKPPSNFFHHEPDLVLEEMRPYQNDVQEIGTQAAFEKWVEPALELANDILEQAINRRHHILYERSMAMPDSVDQIDAFKKEGYDIAFIAIACMPQIARQKIEEDANDRYRDPDDVQKKLKSFSDLWLGRYKDIPAYPMISDRAMLINNTGEALSLMAIKRPSDDDLQIIDADAYQKWKQKTNEMQVDHTSGLQKTVGQGDNSSPELG